MHYACNHLNLLPLPLQGPMTEEDRQQQSEAAEAAEDQRRSMLVALLQPAARDRCEILRKTVRVCWANGVILHCIVSLEGG